VGGQFKRGIADEIAIEAELNMRKGAERIIRAAYGFAVERGLKRMCVSDKSNAMRHGHDLWRRVYALVAVEHPEIESRHLYIALCMQMVREPSQFDVIVTNNLFGDIVTDLGAQLQGGIGLAASGKINPSLDLGQRDDDWSWEAMVRHPDLIGDFNRLDSTILKAGGGQQFSKDTDRMSRDRQMINPLILPEIGVLPVQIPTSMQLGKAVGYALGFRSAASPTPSWSRSWAMALPP
jgi:hypothetical protein